MITLLPCDHVLQDGFRVSAYMVLSPKFENKSSQKTPVWICMLNDHLRW